MYVRKKHNRSGSTSVVVVSKASGKYKEIKSFGSSTSEEEIDSLCDKAATWIRSFGGQQELDFDDRKGKEVEETERFLGNIDNILINGTQLLLDQIYDSIGFNHIPDEILRHLVIARVSQPKSKLATVDYLKSYYDEDVDLNHIYRYMDKFYNTQMELAQQISVEHTRRIFGGKIGLMFYDVTTLYFETSETDVLREPGFSKDGKTAESQVVLGLLVSEGGYPLSYSLFNGSQYEGFTMIPMIEPTLYFYHDSNQNEVDLLRITSSGMKAFEVKSASTYSSHFEKTLKALPDWVKPIITDRTIVYAGSDERTGGDIRLRNYLAASEEGLY